MTDVPISEARARFSDLIDQARISGEPVFLTRHGRQVAAVVDAVWLNQVIELAEEFADIQAAREARAEEGPNIPWEQVKADLGLT